MQRVLILGAAGRDFHNFNVVFRDNPDFHVVAFTATQIPDIAGRFYPVELAGGLYPDGIPILEENSMEAIIRGEHVDVVVFAYSDVPYPTLMHLASRAAAAGADFWLLSGEHTQLVAKVPVVSVCAVRTGCGKSPLSRRIAAELRKQGWHPVVIRHPMPYGDLAEQRAQRFGTLADLDRHKCTIEEREEYEPHIVAGTPVYAGVDYETILRQAEREADVILWDGGNNDTSFYRPDLSIVVLDPHRAGHELAYYPGEVNFRSADVLVINKVDTADPDGIKTVRRNIALHNPKAKVIETACRVSVPDGDAIDGKTVLVVEDGPTLTHGEMAYGAGVVAANRYHAAALVDPRPYAVGSIQKTFEKFAHLWRVLPAMGYSDIQRHELEETIKRVPCELVLVATPIDLARTIRLDKPSMRVSYEVEELGQPAIPDLITEFTKAHMPVLAEVGEVVMPIKDFLSIRDFAPQQIRHYLHVATQLKAYPNVYRTALKGKTLAMIFEKPSLRTRVSFDVGIEELGGHPLYLSPAEISLGKRESVYDVAKNLERMVHGVMIRTFAHEIVTELARHASIPVINGLTDYSHPCQAMADYLTILEVKGHISRLKIAYLGDGNNVARSLMFAGAQLGADVCIATPAGYEPDENAVQWTQDRCAQTDANLTVTNDPELAADAADVVYTDVWASMGQEHEAEERQSIFAPYQVNEALFSLAKPDAMFLHCLPAHRGDEVTSEVIDGPHSYVFHQAENRLHAQKAIMLELMKWTHSKESETVRHSTLELVK